jgi:hypothetical protein
MNNLKEQLQEDIIAYFDGYPEPPWVFTMDDRETMVDDLCVIIVDRISETQNNG